MKKFFALALLAAVSTAGAQTTIFEDDFESYADTPALDGSATWTANSITLSTEQSVSGTQSVKDATTSTGGMTGGHAAVDNATLNATNVLVVTFQLHESDAAATNSRNGLTYGAYDGGSYGSGTLENIFAMGTYHPTTVTNYCRRSLFGGASWADSGIARVNGWHEMSMTFDGANVAFTIDAADAGTDTYTSIVTGFNSMRLGSFVSVNNGQDLHYDDLSIVTLDPSADVQDWHMY